MAKWFKFNRDYNFRWPSRAVTAFKDGMVAYVKDEVVEAALDAKAGTLTTKPDDSDDNHVTTASKSESKAGNPDAKKAPEKPLEAAPLSDTPDERVSTPDVDAAPAGDG